MIAVRTYDRSNKTVNRARTTALLGLGLGLALQTATPDAAWWEWCSRDTPSAPAPWMWYYQTEPRVPGLVRGQPWAPAYPATPVGHYGAQFWQYQRGPFGPVAAWSSTMPTADLYVEQNQSPAGYQIRVRTGQPGTPAVDIDVQGGFLTIQSRSVAGNTGGAGMNMQQDGWATRWVALATDANVAAMQVQWGDGVVEIFIPRDR